MRQSEMPDREATLEKFSRQKGEAKEKPVKYCISGGVTPRELHVPCGCQTSMQINAGRTLYGDRMALWGMDFAAAGVC